MPKSKLSAGVYLALVFLSGALVGGFSARLYQTHSVNASAAPRNPEEWRKRYVSDFKTRVNLDDAQLVQLQQILDETRQKFQKMREAEKPQAQAIANEQTERIRAMLRPEQKENYEAFRAEREKKRQEMDRKKGSPGPGM